MFKLVTVAFYLFAHEYNQVALPYSGSKDLTCKNTYTNLTLPYSKQVSLRYEFLDLFLFIQPPVLYDNTTTCDDHQPIFYRPQDTWVVEQNITSSFSLLRPVYYDRDNNNCGAYDVRCLDFHVCKQGQCVSILPHQVIQSRKCAREHVTVMGKHVTVVKTLGKQQQSPDSYLIIVILVLLVYTGFSIRFGRKSQCTILFGAIVITMIFLIAWFVLSQVYEHNKKKRSGPHLPRLQK